MFMMYPALLTKGGNTSSIKFPDFPEIQMTASSNLDVIEVARRNLENHIATLILSNNEIPLPTPINNMNQDKDTILVLLQISLPELNHNYVKKTLTIPEWVDALAKKHNLNFSHVLTEALLIKIFTMSE